MRAVVSQIFDWFLRSVLLYKPVPHGSLNFKPEWSSLNKYQNVYYESWVMHYWLTAMFYLIILSSEQMDERMFEKKKKENCFVENWQVECILRALLRSRDLGYRFESTTFLPFRATIRSHKSFPHLGIKSWNERKGEAVERESWRWHEQSVGEQIPAVRHKIAAYYQPRTFREFNRDNGSSRDRTNLPPAKTAMVLEKDKRIGNNYW